MQCLWLNHSVCLLQNESLTTEMQSVTEQLATVSNEKLMLVGSTCNVFDFLKFYLL